MSRHSSLRPGVTLIETLVALSLLVGLILLATPMIRVVAGFEGQDGEIQAVAAFDESLQTRASEAESLSVSGSGLLFHDEATVQLLELYRKDQGSLPMLRITQNGKGHMVMLIGVDNIEWQQQDEYVAYVLTMVSGRQYEGVVMAP